ncbi:MAG: alpha/beta fold hydrolase, partial [Candidatus Thorarchaeota archaeon]
MSTLVSKQFSTEYGDIFYYWFQSDEQLKYNVFIHGLGGNRKWFPSDFKTFKLSKHSWIVPDLMGYGDSSKKRIPEAYTMDKQADFVLSVLEEERVEEISILAHSMGGPISISLIEKLVAKKEQKINVAVLLYLEGNLDSGDAFTSSRISE